MVLSTQVATEKVTLVFLMFPRMKRVLQPSLLRRFVAEEQETADPWDPVALQFRLQGPSKDTLCKTNINIENPLFLDHFPRQTMGFPRFSPSFCMFSPGYIIPIHSTCPKSSPFLEESIAKQKTERKTFKQFMLMHGTRWDRGTGGRGGWMQSLSAIFFSALLAESWRGLKIM
jgi:hypothetical protein